MPFTKVIFNTILLIILSYTAFSQKYPEMVRVKGGEFLMGDLRKDYVPSKTRWVKSPNGKLVEADLQGNYFENDGKLRKVFTSDYSISKKPISVGQYQAYCYSMGFDMPKLPVGTKENDPMINISFEDAESYCRWLKRKLGNFYRLPTEAEWEYASRGANLNRPSEPDYKPDGARYKEILVDNDAVIMSNGLVWEWLPDVFADKDWEKYKPRIQRVVRKGTSGKKVPNEQPYYRKGIFQDSTLLDVGFRVVEPGLFKTDVYLYGEIRKL